MHYKSIFISDIHVGSKHARIPELVNFLKENECENLFIVGDFIDGWALKRKWSWDNNCNLLIQKILKKSRKGCRVVYVTGNHDEFLRNYTHLENFGGIEIVDETVYTGINNKRYLIIHGDKFDGILKSFSLVSKMGSVCYEWLLDTNSYLNYFRRKLGFGYWSLSYFLKKNTKRIIEYVNKFEDILAFEAKRHEVDGVICGHIHIPSSKVIDGIEYYNCGCWVEMNTAIVEHFDGKFELLDLE